MRLSHLQCVYVYPFMCMFLYVCVGQTLMSSVFSVWFQPYLLRQGISLNWKLANLATLASQKSPGILPCPVP